MNNAMEHKESELNHGKIDVDIIDPERCQTDAGWDNWQIAFINKSSATLGAAKVPIDYVVRPDINEHEELFLDDGEERHYQMPLTGENFWRDNKLVYTMLKAACIKSDAWTWIQDCDRTANGRKAWLALVEHYDGSGELNKRVKRAKDEIAWLHYKDKKVFPIEKNVTKIKENFYVLEKDKSKSLTGEQQRVDILLRGIRSTNTSIVSARINVFQNHRSDFDKAAEFSSALSCVKNPPHCLSTCLVSHGQGGKPPLLHHSTNGNRMQLVGKPHTMGHYGRLPEHCLEATACTPPEGHSEVLVPPTWRTDNTQFVGTHPTAPLLATADVDIDDNFLLVAQTKQH